MVTPQHIKHAKSTPLRKNSEFCMFEFILFSICIIYTYYILEKHFKSRSAEATNLLQQKDKLVGLQIKALEQEIGINNVRKRNAILKEEKMKLEIELLKTKLNSTKH